MTLKDDCFSELSECPWRACDTNKAEFLYEDAYGSSVVRCKSCGCVYAKRRLNAHGLKIYWENYSSRCHTADAEMVCKREIMYDIDFGYIDSYKNKVSPKVLDVGCGEGGFLDKFKNAGYITYGVEFGREAAQIATKKHICWEGELPKLRIDEKFDLVVFRGVLQYLPDVKKYLEKAIELLNDNGLIFITAQPNMDSLCANLFKSKFVLGVNSADFIGFNERMLTEFFEEKGMKRIGYSCFYEETPYANVEDDVLKVAKAIECKRQGESIDFYSPAYYGNMMSLVYSRE